MVYTKSQIIRVIRHSTSVECAIIVHDNGITVNLFSPESAKFYCTGLAVMHNVRAESNGSYVFIPLNSSGHTLRAERAQYDGVTVRVHTAGDSLD